VDVDLEQGDWDVLAEERGSRAHSNQLLVDLRLEKKISKVRLSVDAFNLLNSNAVTEVWEISSNPNIEFGSPRAILNPRQLRFNLGFDF
jgi:hypothetical protein